MAAVAKGVGNSISDLEAYRKAVQFYFKGADIRFHMVIDLCPAAEEKWPRRLPHRRRSSTFRTFCEVAVCGAI